MGYVIAGVGIIIGVILLVVGLEAIGLLDLVISILLGGASAYAER